MIETKEQYEQWLKLIDPGKGARQGHYGWMAHETIEALRKVARATDELREAMAFNKGTGETKKRLEDAYGALWRAKNALPDWLADG